ncbi:MAG TPA: TIGR00730 family Rossman fold protein, partial [Pseudoxanthomonas sp.]|nr:TIGR00730 family Rossman fold protein [Pseudoxanthomonas sp.]
MKSICVYCGSNAGSKPVYTERAIALGDRIAKEGLQLVYGGGNVGLMGTVADAALQAGGEVIGVIPEQLMGWEVAHKGVTRLEVVAN